eukprot:g14771.t1
MQARVEQSLSSGQALLGIVSCPELGTQLYNLEESWLSLNNQVNHQLHRLEKLLEHCTRSVPNPLNPDSKPSPLTRYIEFIEIVGTADAGDTEIT